MKAKKPGDSGFLWILYKDKTIGIDGKGQIDIIPGVDENKVVG